MRALRIASALIFAVGILAALPGLLLIALSNRIDEHVEDLELERKYSEPPVLELTREMEVGR